MSLLMHYELQSLPGMTLADAFVRLSHLHVYWSRQPILDEDGNVIGTEPTVTQTTLVTLAVWRSEADYLAGAPPTETIRRELTNAPDIRSNLYNLLKAQYADAASGTDV